QPRHLRPGRRSQHRPGEDDHRRDGERRRAQHQVGLRADRRPGDRGHRGGARMTTQAAVYAEPAVVTRERPEPALAGAWLLSAAMVGSGALTYGFHVLAARSLGPHAYGQIAVLWAAMFLGAVVLFRPLEQTASRAIADRLARGEEVRTVLRSVGL